MQAAAVILAAGASTRFGSPKQLVRLGGRTMLETVALIARDAGLDPVIAVVPPGMAIPPNAVPEINDDPSAGIGRSLRLGLAAVPIGVDAAVVLLGDEPALPVERVNAVLRAGSGGASIVAGRSGDRVGPPVLLPRDRFDLADQLHGDAGLGAILRERDGVRLVELGDLMRDIDTHDDLDAVAPRCRGCGARLPAEPGTPAHPYIGASPGCWVRWSELHATTGIGWLGRHANDAYAVQHPGVDGRRERQSVAVHLIALCHWLEHDITDPRLTELTRVALEGRPAWPWLEPPRSYAMTVHDIADPTSAEEGRRWIEAVWAAWSPHHDVVRAWSTGVLAGRSHR